MSNRTNAKKNQGNKEKKTQHSEKIRAKSNQDPKVVLYSRSLVFQKFYKDLLENCYASPVDPPVIREVKPDKLLASCVNNNCVAKGNHQKMEKIGELATISNTLSGNCTLDSCFSKNMDFWRFVWHSILTPLHCWCLLYDRCLRATNTLTFFWTAKALSVTAGCT